MPSPPSLEKYSRFSTHQRFFKTVARFAVLQDNVRISLYDDALWIWEAHPVIGAGLGNYLFLFSRQSAQ